MFDFQQKREMSTETLLQLLINFFERMLSEIRVSWFSNFFYCILNKYKFRV